MKGNKNRLWPFKDIGNVILGQRDDYPSIIGCGQKFICVTAGGTLELHGKDKLSWTKLDTQMNKLTYASGLFYDYQVSRNVTRRWMYLIIGSYCKDNIICPLNNSVSIVQKLVVKLSSNSTTDGINIMTYIHPLCI